MNETTPLTYEVVAMRAIPLMVALAALAASRPALAQVSERLLHSLQGPNWTLVADVDRFASGEDVVANFWIPPQATMDQFPLSPPNFSMSVRAGEAGDLARVMVDADLTLDGPSRLDFGLLGPVDVVVAGPGLDEAFTNVALVPMRHEYLVPPGVYSIHVGLDLQDGEWPAPGVEEWRRNATAQFAAYPLVPEPATWIAALVALALVITHKRRPIGFRWRPRSS